VSDSVKLLARELDRAAASGLDDFFEALLGSKAAVPLALGAVAAAPRGRLMGVADDAGCLMLFPFDMTADAAATVGAPANLKPKIADKFEIYAVLWPKGPKGYRGSCLSYNTQSASAKTKYPDEAFKLLNYLTGPEIAFFMGYDGLLHCGARHSAWINPKLWERFPVMQDAANWFQSGIDPFPQPWNLRFVEWQDAWNNETSQYIDGKEEWDAMFSHTQNRCQTIIDQARP
jgi:hypothetical protein